MRALLNDVHFRITRGKWSSEYIWMRIMKLYIWRQTEPKPKKANQNTQCTRINRGRCLIRESLAVYSKYKLCLKENTSSASTEFIALYTWIWWALHKRCLLERPSGIKCRYDDDAWYACCLLLIQVALASTRVSKICLIANKYCVVIILWQVRGVWVVAH